MIIHIGNATTLAALNAADHSNGDIAYIWLNSWTRKMVLDTSSTKTTDTTNHPYYVQAADTNGTWIEQPGADDPWAFDGSKLATGAVYSTNWSATEGSEIDLDAGTIKLGGSAAPAFSVTAAGVLTATGANISGAITGSTIDIGGADATSFHVDVDGNMWMGAAAFNIATNPFAVSNAGAMRAVSGIIGGLTLSTTALYTGSKTAYNDANAGIHFGTDGIGIGNNIFTVSAAGALVSTSGTIAGLTINATDGLYAGTGATRVQMKPGAAGVGGFWTGATAVADAKNYLNVDGAGKLASGNITWDSSGNLVMTGTWSGSSSVTLAAGADIILTSQTGTTDVDRGLIQFNLNSKNIKISGDYDNDALVFQPSSDGIGTLYLGSKWGLSSNQRFSIIRGAAANGIYFSNGDATADTYSTISAFTYHDGVGNAHSAVLQAQATGTESVTAGVGAFPASSAYYFYVSLYGYTKVKIDISGMTLADDYWIGLGSAAGRIIFRDETVDEISILAAGFGGQELSADPANPSEGNWIMWMSDGTGAGDDGDIMMKVTAGSTTKTITLVDFSAF